MSIGVPIKLMHEAESHIITVELKTGELYRGQLVEAEDNMNMSMVNVTCTGRDGSISTLEQVFVRGGLIRFMILPDILKNAPMFKRIDPKQGILRGKGVGIGRSTMARARRGGPGDRGGGPARGGGAPPGRAMNVRH
uniref:Small nuclear ribonucleoprotein Sm D3 n=1 Tax=Cryptomonas curvata TaxID=233186 RepID=A0A7S0QDX9_9CRYP|mmetsp:Transcript_15857/g.33730  ORF Transcript_15857/g.33730 Transcript_15857/m.33730 type:complete len:137 (+) Transcript_15857:43-453(+)